MIFVVKILEGLPLATYTAIIDSINATTDTMELVQTLKTMGYSIGLISSASNLLVEQLAKKIGIDHYYGVPYEIDDDSQCFTGSISCDYSGINRQSIINRIVAQHTIEPDDITILSTGNNKTLQGIHPIFNLSIILELFNKHTLSEKELTGILASFGCKQQ